MLTFRQMEVFRAVVLCGSVSAAAQSLGVAQPTVTNSIRRLEDVLGVKLFTRSGGRLRTTRVAQQILEILTPSMTALEQLGEHVMAVARGARASFILGASPSVCQALAPRALAKYAAHRPETSLRMDTLSLSQIRDYLWLAEGDCAVTIFPLQDAMIASRQIGTSSIVCVLPSSHPLAGRPALTVQELAGEKLVFFHPNTPHGQLLMDMFRRAGIQPSIAIETRFAETAPILMREGFGIALIDGLSALGIQDPDARVVPLLGGPSLPVLMHHRHDHAESADVTLMHECLLRAVRELGIDRTRTP